jgi:phospholipid/cholesterol/gamma-HCH transport system substrate-binding protein
METRANFILIGAFTLAAILGTLGFFIWLAAVQVDRQYVTYGILFDDVSGLDPSGDVSFNGISVGKVTGLSIYEPDASKVLATVQIDSTTPVRSNTVAQVQSQGVTGVAYISLSGGTPGAAWLTAINGGLPMIESKRSTVQALVEDAPDLLAQATDLLSQFQALTSPENQALVTGILRNLETSSGRLDEALTDFSEISGTVSEATAQISIFTGKLDSISSSVQTTLERADAALLSAQTAFDTADTTLVASGTAIRNVENTFDSAQILLRDTVPPILEKLSEAVTRADTAIADLQQRGGTTLEGFGATAGLLNARLTELEKTLRDADTAFAAVSGASTSFDALVTGEGTAMVADARAVLASAQTTLASLEGVVQADVPAVVADIRRAVTTATEAVERVAGDVTSLTARFDPMATQTEKALAAATALMQRAEVSLGVLDKTLSGTDAALTSAETAFDAATGLMQTDLAPVLNDIRTASDRISVAVEGVARDVPAITADLRALIARADTVVGQVQAAVAATAPGLGDFTQTGLPELTRLSAEARGLVTTLNSLVRRIERDPARFLLDNRVPEYRR